MIVCHYQEMSCTNSKRGKAWADGYADAWEKIGYTVTREEDADMITVKASVCADFGEDENEQMQIVWHGDQMDQNGSWKGNAV